MFQKSEILIFILVFWVIIMVIVLKKEYLQQNLNITNIKKIKSDYYFYVKRMKKREKKTNEFIKRIQQETTYTTFDSKEELLTEAL